MQIIHSDSENFLNYITVNLNPQGGQMIVIWFSIISILQLLLSASNQRVDCCSGPRVTPALRDVLWCILSTHSSTQSGIVRGIIQNSRGSINSDASCVVCWYQPQATAFATQHSRALTITSVSTLLVLYDGSHSKSGSSMRSPSNNRSDNVGADKLNSSSAIWIQHKWGGPLVPLFLPLLCDNNTQNFGWMRNLALVDYAHNPHIIFKTFEFMLPLSISYMDFHATSPGHPTSFFYGHLLSTCLLLLSST